MTIKLKSGFFISEIESSDKDAYVHHFQEKQIYDQTLNIPFPYSESDADAWLDFVATETRTVGRSMNWAIRESSSGLIGGIGFHGRNELFPHSAELGYWLAKPFWNQGIMTEAAQAVTAFAFKKLRLKRITAHVFHFNLGSARVLEKAGYKLEGRLRKYYEKDGQTFDGLLFAAIDEEYPR